MADLGIPGVGDATLIASGGSALVYEALSGTGERLAVKVLRGIRGNEVSRRFEREQSAADRLSGHPHIMRIHHSGVTGAGEPYLVMPLFPKGSLSDELERSGAFTLRDGVNDVITAAGAIDFAHQHGVLHRDIKPGNLLRGDDGSVTVTDFGIARVVDAGISSATVGAATPLYAAPELLAENEASVQSEVYSLGALLYALLAGQAAFGDSENIWATMHRIRTEQPAPIPGVPAPIMRVIDQAMAKEPHDRPDSAGLFRDYLTIALDADESWSPPAATIEIPRDEVVLGPSLRGEPSVPVVVVDTPPVPAFDRPAPAVGAAPRRDSSTSRLLAALAVLALMVGLAWFGVTRLLDSTSTTDTASAPPVDNSLPSPDSPPPTNPDTPPSDTPDEAELADENDQVDIDDLPSSPALPNTFVSFNGDFFSALLPEGWSLLSRDVDEGYGFRSSFITDGMYLNVDTTPREQRGSNTDIAQGARDIAAGINSASEVRTEEVDGLVMHSFTFRNRQGVDSIDIFFEVDGDGYAVVAGSANDPDTAFATARLVALSIRSNPDQ